MERRHDATAARSRESDHGWDLSHDMLEAYFNRNLSQVSFIFWLSAMAMIVGFGIIGWGVFQGLRQPNALVPAVIAAASGLITEFIGATFLVIYRSAVQQAGENAKTLERIHAVSMAIQILETIPDLESTMEVKTQTKAQLAQRLVEQAQVFPTRTDVK
jgi:hypothetical protein